MLNAVGRMSITKDTFVKKLVRMGIVKSPGAMTTIGKPGEWHHMQRPKGEKEVGVVISRMADQAFGILPAEPQLHEMLKR